MKKNTLCINGMLCMLLVIFFVGCGPRETKMNDYPIRPLAFNEVELKDAFWTQRIETNHQVSIPVALHQSVITGRVRNFEIAGGLAEGDFQSDYPFDDSDVFKIIEGASYSLQMFPDPGLEAFIDSLVWIIQQAQEDDGYLFTYRTIHGDGSHPWIGNNRWERTHVLSHELYNMGHMYEAAVAHHRLTGRNNFLDLAIKNADLILREIGPGKFETYPGHQEIEIGLAKLYRVTGNQQYLDLAKYFLDARGHDHIGEPPFRDGDSRTYDQSHKPVTEQTEAVGHAVRALYMYSGMADVAALTGNHDYIRAINRLWEDVTHTKLYVTGGIGSQGGHEGFGPAYDLPNLSAYCETCAAIANVFWNHRLFLLHGDAKYIDVMERSLYNNVLSGVSLSGDYFFYANPLESDGRHERREWFGCACCPSNITRLIPSVPGYMYAHDRHNIYVNLYASSDARFSLGDREVTLSQVSDMPWDGTVNIRIRPGEPARFRLHLRIPGWAQDKPVPGDLYTFAGKPGGQATVLLNGKVQPLRLNKGYLVIDRTWKEGDEVRIELPLDVRYLVSHPAVEANRNKLAVQRGPLVYAVEWPDTEDNSVLDMTIGENTTLTPVYKNNLLGGVVALEGIAKGSRQLPEGGKESFDKKFMAIPYYGWAHRGKGEMMVWMPASPEAAEK